MKHWTIGKQVAFAASGTIVIILLLGAFAVYRLRLIQNQVADITHDCLPGMYLVGKLEAALMTSELRVREHVLNTDPAAMAENEKQMAEQSARASTYLAEYEKTVNDAEDRALFEKMKQARVPYLAARAAVVELSRNGKKAEAIALMKSELQPAYEAYAEAVRNEVDANKETSDVYADDISKGTQHASYKIGIAMGIAMIASLIGAFVVVRGINRVLRRVVSSVQDGATQVSSAASQVSSASQSLAEGANEQAASVEETSASLEEMSSMTNNNSDNANRATEVSQRTRKSAEAGVTHTEEMRRAMDAIKTSSNAVEKIVNTIEEIAFQTNILALNAAVEAARAGEAGMGFAVVADEVRNLAQRAAHAAQETAEKISDAVQKSDRGVAISADVSSALTEILENARQVDALVAEIATASREQSQGITQVNAALSQMDKVTQANAGTAEENAAAAEELNAQAAAMQDAIGELNALIGGKVGHATADLKLTAKPHHVATPMTQSRATSAPIIRHNARRPAQVDFADFDGVLSRSHHGTNGTNGSNGHHPGGPSPRFSSGSVATE